ncbi:hypothetical protein [Granulicella aggregans]|uniref:hypothetical protein n=1 Tax=Granulicella aggregans TaxID=474949 RepID=UPI0021DFBEA2|nr:hypothetical protein [Granulicella aggregans]
MHTKIIQQIETLLTDAEKSRSWGNVEIDIRDGKAVLIRTTRQIKIQDEDTPANARHSR